VCVIIRVDSLESDGEDSKQLDSLLYTFLASGHTGMVGVLNITKHSMKVFKHLNLNDIVYCEVIKEKEHTCQ